MSLISFINVFVELTTFSSPSIPSRLPKNIPKLGLGCKEHELTNDGLKKRLKL